MISGKVSPDDYRAAYAHHIAKTRKWAKILLTVTIFGGVATWPFSTFYGFLLVAMGLGGFLGDWIQHGLWLPRKLRRLYEQQVELRQPLSYRWDAESLSVETSTGRASRPWRNYLKVREGADLFMLYHNEAMWEIIPKSWFPSEELLNDFRVRALEGVSQDA